MCQAIGTGWDSLKHVPSSQGTRQRCKHGRACLAPVRRCNGNRAKFISALNPAGGFVVFSIRILSIMRCVVAAMITAAVVLLLDERC